MNTSRSVPWFALALCTAACAGAPSAASDASVLDASPTPDVLSVDAPPDALATDAPVTDAPAADAPLNPLLTPLDYTDDAHWLCRPGIANDRCLTADLGTTEIHPDGSRTVVTSPVASSPAYDCFYVYPTVDLTSPPGNHTDFTDLNPQLDALLNQAARFREQCRVIAPLYRQATFAGLTGAGAAMRADIAYHDVEAAFREYLRVDGGTRPFVVMGHSQGSFMIERLVTTVIANDAALRSRLIVALTIGGSVQVPTGSTTGGTLGNFPLCTSDDQTGCAVHYHTFAAGHAPPPGGIYSLSMVPGFDTACTNPASLAASGTEAHLSASYFPITVHSTLFQLGIATDPPVTTPFVLYRDFYAAKCTSNANLRSYLEVRPIGATGDVRTDLIPYGNVILSPGLLGLHLLDFNLAMGELQSLVANKAAHLPAAH